MITTKGRVAGPGELLAGLQGESRRLVTLRWIAILVLAAGLAGLFLAILGLTGILSRHLPAGLGVAVLVALLAMISSSAAAALYLVDRLRRRGADVRYLLDYSQSLIDHLPGSICVVDPDYRIRFASDSVRRQMEARGSELCYAAVWDETDPCPSCPLSEVMESGETRTVRREIAGGRVVEHTLSPLLTPEGAPMLLAKSQDITEQVELQKKLALSEKVAVIGEMAAGLAHDLGNPLDGVQRALDLVRRRTPGSSDIHPFLGLMELGLQRMGWIVRRLLVIGRQDELRMRPTNIADVIESALLFLEHRIQELGIAVEKEYAPSLPLVLADPDSLPQALTNLLQNAVEALDGGKGVIRISASPSRGREGRSCVEIQIADSGCGISPQNLARVFDPFFTTKSPGKGTGLGLAMTKRIVQNHGGQIRVDSRVGDGTTFTLSLPAVGEGQLGKHGRRDHPSG